MGPDIIWCEKKSSLCFCWLKIKALAHRGLNKMQLSDDNFKHLLQENLFILIHFLSTVVRKRSIDDNGVRI